MKALLHINEGKDALCYICIGDQVKLVNNNSGYNERNSRVLLLSLLDQQPKTILCSNGVVCRMLKGTARPAFPSWEPIIKIIKMRKIKVERLKKGNNPYDDLVRLSQLSFTQVELQTVPLARHYIKERYDKLCQPSKRLSR